MKSQTFTSIFNVLLLSISLCITELMSPSCTYFEEKVSTADALPFDAEVDVLNPIYIFK